MRSAASHANVLNFNSYKASSEKLNEESLHRFTIFLCRFTHIRLS